MHTKAEIENIEAHGQGFKCPCGPWVSAFNPLKCLSWGRGTSSFLHIELTPNQIHNKISAAMNVAVLISHNIHIQVMSGTQLESSQLKRAC